MGGSPKECTFAASTVLMNMLGLVCDPVGGLVEYPCQNRNAAGVANAIIAAEMALAGIPQLIPLDEMIQTMFTVGKKLPAELRETAMEDALLRHLHVKHAIYAVNRLTNKKLVSCNAPISTYNVHIQDSFYYFSSFASTFDVKCVSKN